MTFDYSKISLWPCDQKTKIIVTLWPHCDSGRGRFYGMIGGDHPLVCVSVSASTDFSLVCLSHKPTQRVTMNQMMVSEKAPLPRSELKQHRTHTIGWPFLLCRKCTCALYVDHVWPIDVSIGTCLVTYCHLCITLNICLALCVSGRPHVLYVHAYAYDDIINFCIWSCRG